MLKEEITPTLAKLKEERSSFLEYQKIVRELEHLNKLYIAYKYVCAEVCTFFCLRTCTSPDTFRRHLKTHYCQQAFQST